MVRNKQPKTQPFNGDGFVGFCNVKNVPKSSKFHGCSMGFSYLFCLLCRQMGIRIVWKNDMFTCPSPPQKSSLDRVSHPLSRTMEESHLIDAVDVSGYLDVPGGKLGSMVNKWVILLPTYTWGVPWGEITHWSVHLWSIHFRPGTSKYDLLLVPKNLKRFVQVNWTIGRRNTRILGRCQKLEGWHWT